MKQTCHFVVFSPKNNERTTNCKMAQISKEPYRLRTNKMILYTDFIKCLGECDPLANEIYHCVEVFIY